jgi:chromosome segregation ATPase
MEGFVESVKGFFILGSRDLADRVKLLMNSMKIDSLDGQIKERMRMIGREGWELGLTDTEQFPAAEKIQEFEAALKEKNGALEDVDKQIKQLQEQKKKHQAHYQKLLNEQLQIKQPVDEELTDLLVEIKRMRREAKAIEIEIKTLTNKLELQAKRKEELKKSSQESTQYLREEIESEIALNERFLALKRENLELLKPNTERCIKQADKVRKVITQYDQQIVEIRNTQRDMLNKDKKNISELQEMRYALLDQIRVVKAEMAPALQKLGGEITTRRIASKRLVEHYRVIDDLESNKEELIDQKQMLRKEIESIGPGIKLGFYSLIVFVILGLGLVFSLMF